MVEHGLRHVEGAGEVDAQDGVPVVDRHLADGLVDGHAGIVDEVVDPTVGGQDLVGDPPAVLGLSDIALVDGR